MSEPIKVTGADIAKILTHERFAPREIDSVTVGGPTGMPLPKNHSGPVFVWVRYKDEDGKERNFRLDIIST